MSRRRPTHQEQYYQSIEQDQERARYRTFLETNGYENTPHHANLYTNRQGYTRDKARETIIMLAGDLPPFYD